MEIHRRYMATSEDRTLSLGETVEAMTQMEDQICYNRCFHEEDPDRPLEADIQTDISKTIRLYKGRTNVHYSCVENHD